MLYDLIHLVSTDIHSALFYDLHSVAPAGRLILCVPRLRG